MLVKVRHCGPQRNLTKTLKLSLLLFIPFSPITRIQPVNLTTSQSRDFIYTETRVQAPLATE